MPAYLPSSCVTTPTRLPHRNLRNGTTIEILELQQVCWHRFCEYFWGKTPCKKSADLHPRQGNYYQRNHFSAVYKTYLHFTK
jgi:hypothetical protein